MDEEERALLEEDLRSPCTEEIAVFRAFARPVREAERDFVVLDTAPTGHTLPLLDAAQSYHREVERAMGDVPEAVRRLLPRCAIRASRKSCWSRWPNPRQSWRQHGCGPTCAAPPSSRSDG